MIFNKPGSLLNDKFIPDNVTIDYVKSYAYLGLVFVLSGSFKPAMETLCKKASKAMFKLKRSLDKLSLLPKLIIMQLRKHYSGQ